jgi:hypothetical protein
MAAMGLLVGLVAGRAGELMICMQSRRASAAMGVATSGSSSRPSVNEFTHDPSGRWRLRSASIIADAPSMDCLSFCHCRQPSRCMTRARPRQ